MPAIQVQRFTDGAGIPTPWLDRLFAFSDQVRHKAFELFEETGRPHGHDVNHWLDAERQILSVPRYELFEAGDALELRIAVPGFDAGEIEIAALPDALLVKAESGPSHEKQAGQLRYSEFDEQALFRRIPLSARIDVSNVTARLDKGILTVTAPKASSAAEQSCQICGMVQEASHASH